MTIKTSYKSSWPYMVAVESFNCPHCGAVATNPCVLPTGTELEKPHLSRIAQIFPETMEKRVVMDTKTVLH